MNSIDRRTLRVENNPDRGEVQSENSHQKAPNQLAEGLSIWWRGMDLNHGPSGYEPDELPDCSTPRRFRPIQYSANLSVLTSYFQNHAKLRQVKPRNSLTALTKRRNVERWPPDRSFTLILHGNLDR